jgi:hypothetical protein
MGSDALVAGRFPGAKSSAGEVRRRTEAGGPKPIPGLSQTPARNAKWDPTYLLSPPAAASRLSDQVGRMSVAASASPERFPVRHGG